MAPQICLNQTLADFHDKRATIMPADQLKANVDQRRLLAETADRSLFVKRGDSVQAFTLAEVDEGDLTLDVLLENGPLVLIFFRFAKSPTCNVTLSYYNRYLAPDLARIGATLVGVSPQAPQNLREIKEQQALDFRIATDRNNLLGRRFGILYSLDEPSRRGASSSLAQLEATTEAGRWELPMPAAIVIDRNHTVRFSDVSPDWLVRTEPADIIAAVQDLVDLPAAQQRMQVFV